MLTELRIRNFAIIESLDLTFGGGMNVLTGETGAGKSIIIEAVNLILGDRASAALIRSGEKEAVVEALFVLDGDGRTKSRLEQLGIEAEEELVIRRVISEGKNRVFINGAMSTLAMLTDLCEGLISISSQHEHQTLLKPENHTPLLDGFGGLEKPLDAYKTAYERYRTLSETLARLVKNEAGREERRDLLAFQLGEISRGELKPGEDEALLEERDILANAEKLAGAATFGEETLYSSDGSLLERLGEVATRLREAASIDPSLGRACETVEGMAFQMEDIARELRDYADRTSYDPAKLESVSARLSELEKLKKKYGPTMAEVIARGEAIAAELEAIESGEENREEVEARLMAQKEEALKLGRRLSEARQKTAAKLSAEMKEEMADLGMAGAVLDVRFLPSAELSPSGLEEAEFYLSANPGEEPKPLARIASGGELSRIMLALKRRILSNEKVPSLVFDEVDAGIGGGTAEIVGRKLKEVSMNAQVICITHLPQIAAMGDCHYKVAKKVLGGRTCTAIELLGKEERLDEISRMLGGVKITETTKNHAREMLEQNAQKS